MFTNCAALAALILPSFALAAPRQPIEERAGAAIGDVFAGAPISNITIRADNVFQCRDALVSWSGATDPVSLFIALGGLYVGETPITTISDIRGGSTTWLVNQAAGETVEFRVTDAKGAVAYVQNIKIGAGETWCTSGSTTSTVPWRTISTEQAWTESPSTTWSPVAQNPTTTATPVQDAVAATSTTSTSSTTRTSTITSSSRSSTSTSTSTTSSSSFAAITPPTTSATTANTNATLAGAGAASASASRTGGASRDIAGGSGIAVALVAGAILVSWTL